ncbi:ribosomal RNA small subunit methyltransferase A [bacterium]|nr:ribosomal RNA small subunit methyltransferase A [bacterium]
MELQAKKSLGQNFLNNRHVPKVMCDAAELLPKEVVLEIGPGTGVLTHALLERGVTVIALEADLRSIEILQEKFGEEISSGQLTVRHADVREFDLSAYSLKDHGFKVVANIPYYLSGWLFRSLLETDIQPTQIVFLVQKEVAKRAVASVNKGEKMSLLSVATQIYGDVSYVKTVTRGNFTPSPKVDSAIISVNNINRDNFQHVSEKDFFKLLHLGFQHKRKQLLGNLSRYYKRSDLVKALTNIGLDEKIRAEDLSIGNWLSLTNALTERMS